MRGAQIFEQEMPAVRLGIPLRVEALHQPAAIHSRHLTIERDLPAPGIPAGSHAIRVGGLQNERARRAIRRAGVAQLEPNDAGQNGVACVLHHDVANAPLGEHAGTAKRVGQMCR